MFPTELLAIQKFVDLAMEVVDPLHDWTACMCVGCRIYREKQRLTQVVPGLQ